MKRLPLILLAFIAVSCGICKPCKPIVEYRDSIVIHERIIHDTAKVEIPVEVEKIVTRETVSHLENTYAKSDAVVSEGFLWHSLESKPQIIYVPVEVQVSDTTSTHSEVITQYVEVEKQLTWWQTFRLKAFWWMAGAIALLLFAIIEILKL